MYNELPMTVNGFTLENDSAGVALMRNGHCFTTRRTLEAALKVANDNYWGNKQRSKRARKNNRQDVLSIMEFIED